MKGLEASEFSDNYHDVVKNLKLLYRNKIYEIEKKYRFDEFHGQALRASDIDGVYNFCVRSPDLFSQTNGSVVGKYPTDKKTWQCAQY